LGEKRKNNLHPKKEEKETEGNQQRMGRCSRMGFVIWGCGRVHHELSAVKEGEGESESCQTPNQRPSHENRRAGGRKKRN